MAYTDRDEKGAYIVLPEDDNDFVTLRKINDQYVYVIRGCAIESLAKYEDNFERLEERCKQHLSGMDCHEKDQKMQSQDG